MKRVEEFVSGVLKAAIVALFTGIVVILTAAVVSRLAQTYLPLSRNVQLFWAEEVIKYALFWICYLGSALLVREKGHIAVGLLPGRITGSAWYGVMSFCLSLALAAVLLYYGTLVTLSMRVQMTPSLQIPKAFIMAMVPVTGLLMIYYLILNLVDALREKA